MKPAPISKAKIRTLLLSTALVATVLPAAAQTPAAPMDDRILQILVAKKVITKAEAQKIQAEAAATPAPAPAAAPPMPAPTPAAATVPAGGVNGDVQTVPYIPDSVKKELKAELREEMATKAETECWAKPGLVPGWLGKVRLFGDLRVRDERRSLRQEQRSQHCQFLGAQRQRHAVQYQSFGCGLAQSQLPQYHRRPQPHPHPRSPRCGVPARRLDRLLYPRRHRQRFFAGLAQPAPWARAAASFPNMPSGSTRPTSS